METTMNKKFTLIAAIAAAVTVGSVLAVARQAGTPDAPDAPDAEQMPVTQLGAAQVQQQKASVIAAAGRGVLQRIDSAYGLIEADKTDDAKKALNDARQLLGQIDLALKEDGADPTKAVDEALFVPLFASLGIAEQVDMTPELKQGLEGLSPLIARGDHEAVVQRLEQFQVEMTYSYVEMPLKKVGDEVDAAIKALQAGDKDGAKAFLKAAAEANVSASVTVGAEDEPKDQG
jgi:hypothetical protein